MFVEACALVCRWLAGVYIWAYWFCLSSRSCCSSVRVIYVCFWLFIMCVCVLSALFLFLFMRHLTTEAKTASPLESAVHSIVWFHQLGGEPSPSDHSLVKSILRCAAFAGPSNQEGAYHSLSVRAVSCLQGGLDGSFLQYSFGCYLLVSFCCLSQIWWNKKFDFSNYHMKQGLKVLMAQYPRKIIGFAHILMYSVEWWASSSTVHVSDTKFISIYFK